MDSLCGEALGSSRSPFSQTAKSCPAMHMRQPWVGMGSIMPMSCCGPSLITTLGSSRTVNYVFNSMELSLASREVVPC